MGLAHFAPIFCERPMQSLLIPISDLQMGLLQHNPPRARQGNDAHLGLTGIRVCDTKPNALNEGLAAVLVLEWLSVTHFLFTSIGDL